MATGEKNPSLTREALIPSSLPCYNDADSAEISMPRLAHPAACVALLVAVLSGLPCTVRADEAVLPDGRHLPGQLTFSEGRLHFLQKTGSAQLPLADTHTINFRNLPTTPLRSAVALRVALPYGQYLTGELRGLDEQRLRLRPAWAEEVVVPRSAVGALTQSPGWLPLFAEDFDANLKGWQATGMPTLAEQPAPTGQRCLVLSRPGQAVTHTLVTPLAAGVVGVDFRQTQPVSGARWLVEAEFQGEKETRNVRATVAGRADGYGAEVPNPGHSCRRLPKSSGWHRLRVEFAPAALVVSIDDAALWHSRQEGPGGPLRQVRLRCTAEPEDHPVQGEVIFSNFSLLRAVDRVAHPVGDVEQDEVWLASGDQLFGVVPRADLHIVEVQGRFGARRLPWTEVRGIVPRRQATPPRTMEGEHVRVWLTSGDGAERDQLVGVLRSFDEHDFVLQHALLGECHIRRERLRQLRWRFHGRRIELDNGFHHLGDVGQLSPLLQPARAEGPNLQRTFGLDGVPEKARLTMDVVQLRGRADGDAAALERGEGRTEVLVNGQVLDYLNRLVDRATAEPRHLTLDVPARLLREGENRVELRQTVEPASGRRPHCGIACLALELPR